MVQEYGEYFGMRTTCLTSGCLPGPNHSGVELHGFLSYFAKVNVQDGVYNVFGYKGKQVRDNIHSYDVSRAIDCIIGSPRCGEVCNIGGCRANSCSILEAFGLVESITGKRMKYTYVEQDRQGDHICHITNLGKLKDHYPGWDVTISLEQMMEARVAAWADRLGNRD